MKTKTIVLIHGMFMSPLCWENWIPYYESKGYKVIAPAWPGRDRSNDELRKAHPDSQLAKLKLGDIVERMESVIKGLDEKPAIIGHSMGGLVVQLLLQRDVAANRRLIGNGDLRTRRAGARAPCGRKLLHRRHRHGDRQGPLAQFRERVVRRGVARRQ